MDDFHGKVAVVTGGASGIGLALATHLVDEGMKVAIADIEIDALDEAADQLRGHGGEVLTAVIDVADADQVDNFRDQVLDAFGSVHVVCNNAGVGGGGLSWEISPEVWEWVVGVNLLGVVNGIRAFVPTLIAQNEGHVVNTASIAGLTSTPGLAPYNATKHAVVTISETLFHDLRVSGATNVGVSVLCPSFVQTKIAQSDRNAPDSVKAAFDGELAAAEAGMREFVQAMVDAGIPASQVAGQVIAAIREQRFYILTHPESVDWVRARCEAILGGHDPASSFG